MHLGPARSGFHGRADMLRGIHHALLIYNTASGRRRDRRLAEVEEASRVLQEAGIHAELAATTGRGSATALARQAVEQNRQLVIVCGGDGTINEVVNGLAGSQVPLAVLPAGTANVLAKELGIPWDIAAAAELIPRGTSQRIALGAFTTNDRSHAGGSPRYFISMGGAGPDGAMVHALENLTGRKTSILDYWVEGVRQLFRYRFPEFRITSNGRELKATLIVVGRTQHYGGPFRITTEASLFEDCFEVVAYTTRNRFRYLMCLPALWLGRLRQLPDIHCWKTTHVSCEPIGDEPVFAQVDGEPVGQLPLQFTIVPDALTLVIPSPYEAASIMELQAEAQRV